MTSSSNNVTNAVGGKTSRACDSCITNGARWYCAADDAFLCEGCDSSIHSANPLARRHERLLLQTASSCECESSYGPFETKKLINYCVPSWHKGFIKKARTPRRHRNYKHSTSTNPFHLVPQVGYWDDTNSHEESGEQLLYRVPVLCTSPSCLTEPVAVAEAVEVETKGDNVLSGYDNRGDERLHGFLPSDAELDEFDADVECLLGKGIENECMGMEELGLVYRKVENSSYGKVKVEYEEKQEVTACKVEVEEIKIGREPFELCFGYDDDDDDDSPLTCEGIEKKVALDAKDVKNGGELEENKNQAKRDNIHLQLDYEGVITAWACQKSPWVTGDKPDFKLQQSWPHCMMGTLGVLELHHHPYRELGGLFGGHPAMADGGREARVSRYREKRRTRMFSKKIRYEVRKLNAEKRPRMKGRFVKRACFAASPTFPLLNK